MKKLLSGPTLQARKGFCVRFIVTADGEEIIQDLRQITANLHSLVEKDDIFIGMEGQFTNDTPDGRIGGIVQAWGVNKATLIEQFMQFILDVVLPLPTTSCFDASIKPIELIPIGKKVASVGDIWKTKTSLENRVTWTIPTFDGEFMIQHSFGLMKGIYRINVKVMGRGRLSTLAVVKSIVKTGQEVEGVTFTPANTARRVIYVSKKNHPPFDLIIKHQYCPTLMTTMEDTKVPAGVDTVYLTSLFALSEKTASTALQKIINLVNDEENIIALEFVSEDSEDSVTIELQ